MPLLKFWIPGHRHIMPYKRSGTVPWTVQTHRGFVPSHNCTYLLTLASITLVFVLEISSHFTKQFSVNKIKYNIGRPLSFFNRNRPRLQHRFLNIISPHICVYVCMYVYCTTIIKTFWSGKNWNYSEQEKQVAKGNRETFACFFQYPEREIGILIYREAFCFVLFFQFIFLLFL